MFMEMENRSKFGDFSRDNPYRLFPVKLKGCPGPAVLLEPTGGAGKS